MSTTSNLSASQNTNSGAQFTDAYGRGAENQGIFDGRPEGQQPPLAKTTLDTYIDKDASAAEPLRASAESTLGGATSKDVYESAGKPGSGMSSQERHHDGQAGRKNPGRGLDDQGYGVGGGKEWAGSEGVKGFKVE